MVVKNPWNLKTYFVGGCSGIGGGQKPLNSCVNDGPSCSGRYFNSRYFSFRYPEHFCFGTGRELNMTI